MTGELFFGGVKIFGDTRSIPQKSNQFINRHYQYISTNILVGEKIYLKQCHMLHYMCSKSVFPDSLIIFTEMYNTITLALSIVAIQVSLSSSLTSNMKVVASKPYSSRYMKTIPLCDDWDLTNVILSRKNSCRII